MTTPVFVSSRVRENASNNNGQFNRASQRIFITPAAAAPDTTASTKGKTNHATTQANMNSADLMESDENKKLGPKSRSQQFYSKQDIVEQYCLSDKQLQVLNRVRQPPALFGCISSHRESSSCGARSSPNLLTACVRRRIPSDENLQDLYKRLPADCAPYSRWSRYHHCHPDVFPVHHCHQSDLAEAPPPPPCQRSPAARRHKCWPPEDEGCPHRTCHPTCHRRATGFDCPEFHTCTPHYLPPPPPPPPPQQSTTRMRHVSFARSHTVTSFDNVSLKSANSSKSLERLIDGRKAPEPVSSVESPKIIVLEKIKRAQKVQATQTDGARDTSPATPHKVKSVMKKNTQQNEIPKSIIRPSEPLSNEILIDFEPKDPPYRKQNKTILHKTVSDGEILIGEIARCRSREDVEASVSDGEQCYKNLVAASCTVEGSLENFHENESILCEGIYKSKSSVCLSESPNKGRAKTPSSSNEQEPSDLSQTTVLQFESLSKKTKLKEDNLCDVVQKKIIRYTDLPLKSSDLIEQGNGQNTLGTNCPTAAEPSEVSTSTEDYVTATDSASYTTTPTQGPSVTSSSFDSESSKYSLPHPMFDHDTTLDPTDPIDEELGDGEDSSDDESSTSGRSIPNNKPKSLEEPNKLNNPDLISSNRLIAKCHADDTNSNLIKKLMGNGFATKISQPVYSSDESSKAPKRRRRPSPRRKSIGAVTIINSIDKKPSVVNKPEKRRESLPEILRKPQITLDTMEKSKTEFHLEDEPLQTKSSQMNYLSQINNLNLKTVSAESLRSISPGSDSVFYSEPCSRVSLLSRCTLCNTEVDVDYTSNTNSDIINIVKPPEGFGDSPEELPNTPIKRLTKRYRSEDRKRNTRSEQTRAKSEERVKHTKEKGRPMTRSTNVSMERLNGSSSSLHSDDDDWSGVYTTPFTSFSWVYIDEIEEFYVWKKPSDLPDIKCSPELKRRDSIESTCSEHEFRVKYQTITHRMVHRKSSLEMFKRIASKSFDSDERLMVKRESGEFGFRIHGAKPVVVSAIETGTAAENSGLQVGDIIISINDMCVLDASHSEFVNVAHSGSDVLELEVARTCDILTPVIDPSTIEDRIVIASKLWKFSIGTKKMKNCWQPRYFCLKTDNCLYYYKSASLKRDRHPLGALNLKGFTVMQTSDTGRMYSFRLERKDHKKTRLHIAANSAENADRWIGALSEATKSPSMEWLDEDNLKSVVTIDPQSDCQGFLSTLVHHCGKSWKKYYCVLKGARLYFFVDSVTRFANGMACLHGYKVQSSVNASVRKFAFELIPPDLSFRYFYFYTDTEVDKRRWIAALEYSIDRWINVS